MYNVLSRLRAVEGTQPGRDLVVYVKFRNERDGIIDVHAKISKAPIMSVSRRGEGYAVHYNSTSDWLLCDNAEQVYAWVFQKLTELIQ